MSAAKESYEARIDQLVALALWLLRPEVRESIGDARYVWLEPKARPAAAATATRR